MNLRVSSRFAPSIGFSLTNRTNDLQPRGTQQFNGTSHYVFAHLEQRQASMSVRLDYTMTRTLSLQVYANPFVSKGTYSNAREITATPGAASFGARYQPYADTTYVPGASTSSRSTRTWCCGGSTGPARRCSSSGSRGATTSRTPRATGRLAGMLQDILQLQPKNTFLVKASYWLSW